MHVSPTGALLLGKATQQGSSRTTECINTTFVQRSYPLRGGDELSFDDRNKSFQIEDLAPIKIHTCALGGRR